MNVCEQEMLHHIQDIFRFDKDKKLDALQADSLQ